MCMKIQCGVILTLFCSSISNAFLIPRERRGTSNLNASINIDNNEIAQQLKLSTRRKILQSTLLTPIMPSVAKAMYTDPVTKIVLPSEGEVESAIGNLDDNPFENLDKASFSRLDQTPDTVFYKDPRFTEHIDENAVELATRYISDILHENDSVLDLCSSWTSHIDKITAQKLNLRRVAGLGMNEEELKANPVLTDYSVIDLNAKVDVNLPYEDNSFDVVLCQLSIDYLIYPLDVMREVSRVLKPGGSVHILFSNRLFIQKAVGLW